MVSHNLGAVGNLADTVGVMRKGRLVEWGPAARVLRFPEHPYTQELLRAVPRLDRAAAWPEGQSDE